MVPSLLTKTTILYADFARFMELGAKWDRPIFFLVNPTSRVNRLSMPEKGETVKLTILAAIVLTILGTSHAIACEVEDLRWEYVSKIKSLQIEGGHNMRGRGDSYSSIR